MTVISQRAARWLSPDQSFLRIFMVVPEKVLLLGLALVARAMQQWQRAVRLLAAIDKLLALGSRLEVDVRNEYEQIVAELKNERGEEPFALAWGEGQGMTFEQVVVYALALVE